MIFYLFYFMFCNYDIFTNSEQIVNSEFDNLNNFVQSKVPTDVEFKIPLINDGFVWKFLSNLNVRKSTG